MLQNGDGVFQLILAHLSVDLVSESIHVVLIVASLCFTVIRAIHNWV